MNILEVQDLCKTNGTGESAIHALRHVTFSVHKGEFIAIIGESGSGKSTLLNIAGALDSATSGKVCLVGKERFPRKPDILLESGLFRFTGWMKQYSLKYILGTSFLEIAQSLPKKLQFR